MSVIEKTGVMKYKDKDGQVYLMLPITTADKVDGAVSFYEQELSEEEKAQARANIGAISADEVPDVDVDLSGVVKTINGTAPDENGNVEIEVPETEVQVFDFTESISLSTSNEETQIAMDPELMDEIIQAVQKHNAAFKFNFIGIPVTMIPTSFEMVVGENFSYVCEGTISLSGPCVVSFIFTTTNGGDIILIASSKDVVTADGLNSYETTENASAKLQEAKGYADSAASQVKNDLLNGAGTAYDTLKELGDLIDDNTDALAALEQVAAGKADKDHTHEIVQSDWNQNDSTQADYVKNRPFYIAEPVLTTVLEETSVTIASNNGYTQFSTGVDLELGQTYTVTFNGTSYDCVAYEMWGANVIGNSTIVGGSTGNNEPFLIVGGNDLIYATTAGTYTVSVTAMVSEVIKLDAKYLPDEATEQAGLKVEGQTFVIDETDVTAEAGAEIFNNYKNNKATGAYSHAEGHNTTASGVNSHAEGSNTTASGADAHAEGYKTKAAGKYSHSEGHSAEANGDMSHAEGHYSVATGSYSHAEGVKTIATADASHAQGKYNIEDTDGTYAHIVGNGTSAERSNAHTLDWDGNAWYAGDVYVGGTAQNENAKKLATEEFVLNNAGGSDIDPDTLELITVADIDTICGTTIQLASEVEF